MTRQLTATTLAYNRRVDINLEPVGKESARTYPHASPDARILWQPSMPSVKAVMGAHHNFAFATAGTTKSNTTWATVPQFGSAFSNEGFVIGKVFASCNGSGDQYLYEPGIPGARVLLEDQTSGTIDAKAAPSAAIAAHISDVEATPPGASPAETAGSASSSPTGSAAMPSAPADPEST